MSGRNRERKPGRREAFRDPRPSMLIVCEGEKTEKQYFEQFARYHKNALVQVKVADEHGVAFTLVTNAKKYKLDSERAARQQKDQNLAYDSVWCVFDHEHPHIPEARVMADKNGIELAISNPCFELWLVLHHRDAPGMTDGHHMQRLLKDFIADYDKHVQFSQYAPGYDKAVDRARKLDALAHQTGEPGRNPTTHVYKLTEMILNGRESEEPV